MLEIDACLGSMSLPLLAYGFSLFRFERFTLTVFQVLKTGFDCYGREFPLHDILPARAQLSSSFSPALLHTRNVQCGVGVGVCRWSGSNHWFREVWRAHLDSFGLFLSGTCNCISLRGRKVYLY